MILRSFATILYVKLVLVFPLLRFQNGGLNQIQFLALSNKNTRKKVLITRIVLKILYLPSKPRLSAKYSLFGRSLIPGQKKAEKKYHPPEGVYLLNSRDLVTQSEC